MIKCPKDADINHNDVCDVNLPKSQSEQDADSFDSWFCTRKFGHTGKHHAHDEKGNCRKVWN